MSTYFNVLGKVGKVKPVGEKMTIIDVASNYVIKGTTHTVWANVMFYTDSVSKVLPYIKVGDTLFISGRLSTIKDKTSGFDRIQLMGDRIDLCGFKDKSEPKEETTESKPNEDAPW